MPILPVIAAFTKTPPIVPDYTKSTFEPAWHVHHFAYVYTGALPAPPVEMEAAANRDKGDCTLMYIPQKLLISLAATCAMAGGLAAKTDKPSRADSHFMEKAAQGDKAEVQMGRLAAQHAASEQVKQFGQRMVDDHTKADSQLTNIASQQGVTLPEKINRKDQKQYDHLATLNGHKFDKAYMKYMVKDHKKDASEFKHEAEHGKNHDVQNFASQTEPILQDHLRSAKQTNAELK